jgi:hypothetical protein
LFVARSLLFIIHSFLISQVSIVILSMNLYNILISFGTVFAKCTSYVCEILEDELTDIELLCFGLGHVECLKSASLLQ